MPGETTCAHTSCRATLLLPIPHTCRSYTTTTRIAPSLSMACPSCRATIMKKLSPF